MLGFVGNEEDEFDFDSSDDDESSGGL